MRPCVLRRACSGTPFKAAPGWIDLLAGPVAPIGLIIGVITKPPDQPLGVCQPAQRGFEQMRVPSGLVAHLMHGTGQIRANRARALQPLQHRRLARGQLYKRGHIRKFQRALFLLQQPLHVPQIGPGWTGHVRPPA